MKDVHETNSLKHKLHEQEQTAVKEDTLSAGIPVGQWKHKSRNASKSSSKPKHLIKFHPLMSVIDFFCTGHYQKEDLVGCWNTPGKSLVCGAAILDEKPGCIFVGLLNYRLPNSTEPKWGSSVLLNLSVAAERALHFSDFKKVKFVWVFSLTASRTS